MPAKTQAAAAAPSLFKLLGKQLVEAHNQHATAETVLPGGGDLPPGVNGIAQLVSCEIKLIKDGDNQGKPMFYAAGVVVEPETFYDKTTRQEMKVGGLRTNISEMLFDTPDRKGENSAKTVGDHIGRMYNYLRLLGLDTSQLNPQNIEASMAALVESGVYYRFRTWQGKATDEYPDPRTNHTWGEAVEYEPEPAAEGAVAAAPEPVAAPVAAAAAPKAAKAGPAPKAAPVAAAAPVVAPNANPDGAADEPDLDKLGEDANGGEQEAIDKLVELATAAGLDEATINGTPAWGDLVPMIREAGGGAAAEVATEWVPEVKDIYGWKVSTVNKGKKTVAKSATDCDVVAVDTDKKTVTLKDKATGKTYKGVSWDELETSAS